MIQGICRVCGSPLAAPITHCPACETPHHQDCWEYNRGCSIYGCSPAVKITITAEVDAPTALVIVPEQVAAALSWRKKVVAGLAAGFAGAWLICGLGVAVEVLLPALAVAFVIERRRAQAEELENMDAGTDPNTARDLERKAIAALVGAHVPDQLAQAYALFEQRHPRDSLPAPKMKALALELVDHGYWALGIEAADKALRLPGLSRDAEVTARRRHAYLRDPAYLVDGLSASVGQDHPLTFKGDGEIGALGELPDGEGPFFLLSLLPQGWSQSTRRPLQLTSHSVAPRSILGHRMVGPLPRDRAAMELSARWGVDQPCVAIPAALVTLSPLVEEVLEVHLSQKEARFKTAIGERVVEWRQIKNVIYGRLERVTTTKEVEVVHSSGSRAIGAGTATSIKETVDSQPLLEVHFGPAPNRLRLDVPRPDLFNYLGRRRELSHAANMALTAKDLSRFGPGIRVSHGLTALLSERLAPGMRFTEMDHFEEYVLWFWALGLDAVKARWIKTQEALLRRSVA